MRKLHLVGVTDDQKGLIFSGRRGSKSGGYVVPIEDDLIGAIAGARRTSDGTEPPELAGMVATDEEQARRRNRPNSTLTPREIQARLRAGHSIVDVAEEAQVGTEWVERFAIPILAEQAQVVEHARGLRYSKPRLGESLQPLGKSVAQNLADRGVRLPDDVFDSGWTAFQLHDSVWVVRFAYHSRARLQEAAWELDAETDMLTSSNRLASELGYVERTRRRRKVAAGSEGPEDEEPPPPPRRTKPKPAAKRAPAKKVAKAPTRPRKAPATARPSRAAKSTKRTASTGRKSAGATARPARRAAKGPATAAQPSPRKAPAAPRAARATALTGRVRPTPEELRPPAQKIAVASTTPVRPTREAPAAPSMARAEAPIRAANDPSRVTAMASAERARRAPAVTGDIDIESLLEPPPPPPPPVDVEDVEVPLLVRRVRAKRAVIAAPPASEAAERGNQPATGPAGPERPGQSGNLRPERPGQSGNLADTGDDTEPSGHLRIRRQLRFRPVPAS